MRASDKTKRQIRSHDKQIFETEHDEIMLWLYKQLKQDSEFVASMTGVDPDDMTEFWLKLESPLSGAAGFADLEIVALTRLPSGHKYSYMDVAERDGKSFLKHFAFVEVKTSVNVGETMRQINFYRAKLYQEPRRQRSKWFVCAPTFLHADVLKEQGIGFIEYTHRKKK